MNDTKYRGALLPEKKRSGRKQPDKKNRQKNIFVWCVLAFPLLNFLVFYVAVNAQSFLYAFQQYDSNLNLRWAGFQNFSLVLERFKNTPDFWRYTVNSLIYFLVPTAIGMPLNMVFGYLLYTKIRGGAVLRTLLLLPAMLSSLSTAGIARTGVAAAVAVLMMIPPVVIFLFSQNSIVETMAHSGMKG